MNKGSVAEYNAPAIYFFGGDHAVQPAPGIETVGAKAGNLMRMSKLGLPVPPGFTLGTDHCARYFADGSRLPGNFERDIARAVETLESTSNRRLGSARRPLLLSVRSGAAKSMPGMLETVLNVGLNDVTVSGFVRSTGNPRLAWDSYRRFIQTFAEVVHGCRKEPFEQCVRESLAAARLEDESEMDTPTLRQLALEFKDTFAAVSGRAFPQEPITQLCEAIEGVFRSWMSDKAVEYRRLRQLQDLRGTAVTVQTMVFGNAGATSGSGVGFTRNPATGAPGIYLDFLFNAQGEDVVAGRHAAAGAEELRALLPRVYAETAALARTLENEFGDLQDFEFTVEEGRLFVLQTRTGKRTPLAALNIAADMVEEGLIEPNIALERLADVDLETIATTRFEADDAPAIATASPASVGVASGRIAFDSVRARALDAAGEPVILVRHDASTEDIEGIAIAAGIVSAAGAKTSHAAVVARELGKVCLVGCRDLRIEPDAACCTIGGHTLNEGDFISLDGDGGRIYAGERRIVRETPREKLARVAAWRAECRESAG